MDNFVNINIKVNGKIRTVKMEKGCFFENKGGNYYVDDKGQLTFCPKNTPIENRTSVDFINMREYQFNAFKAIANNVIETNPNELIFSKKDLETSFNQYRNHGLKIDMDKTLNPQYHLKDAQLYSKYHAFSAYVSNDNPETSANLIFGYGTVNDLEEVQKNEIGKTQTQTTQPSTPKTQTEQKPSTKGNSELGPVDFKNPPIVNKNNFEVDFCGIQKVFDQLSAYKEIGKSENWMDNDKINLVPSRTYTVSKDEESAIKIAKDNGVSFYRLKQANPEIDLDHLLKKGTQITIPERYTIKPGTVHNVEDLEKATGVSKDYIWDILMGIEGKLNHKPALKAYYDKDDEKKEGTLTIGFGHTGHFHGRPLREDDELKNEDEALEILAQDILDNKLDAIEYMGKDNFYAAPQSIQDGIIDLTFCKGIEAFTERRPSNELLDDLKNCNYAMAASHMSARSKDAGLMKRNVYRIIAATTSLSPEDRKKALEEAKWYYEQTRGYLSGGTLEQMDIAWENALKGKTTNFKF